jgi:hypothetical protein
VTVTLKQEIVIAMSKVNKSDCMSIVAAATSLKVSRATLYNYTNILGMQRIRFPFDRKSYLLNSDVEAIRQFMEQNKG